jgi:predicted SpoU family rRNA methylase
MAALKLVRESHRPKRDNRVDAIGYVELAGRHFKE